MPGTLTMDTVKSAVASYWNRWKEKSADGVAGFYSSKSTAFRAESVRLEPGVLVVKARSREYFDNIATLEVDVGPVEVTLLSGTAAIATYVFAFRALDRAKPSALGVRSQEHLQNVRATQVFELDTSGEPRIVHEHFSLPTA